MTSPKPSMNSLPPECIQRIAAFLPCSSVLQFLLVSRSIEFACDNWQVYREVIRNDPDFPDEVVSGPSETTNLYKKLVIASTTAGRDILPNNFDKWLPQLLACHRKTV
jgi:F-box domain